MKTDSQKKAFILMNLGSPDSPAVKDVRRYLNEFLMDGRVIDSPWLLRTILVKGIITPFRAANSAEAYHSIWTKEGSPLVNITRELAEALKSELPGAVYITMRYGNPAMKAVYDQLLQQHPDVTDVTLVPLYPHYAMSSYETAVEHAKTVHASVGYSFKISFVSPFYSHPRYIAALADSIQPYLNSSSHLLFSYHSIPVRHLLKSDTTGSHCNKVADCCNVDSAAHKTCYKHQCLVTTKLVAERLGLQKGSYSVAFQSKLGRAEWLTPATTKRMEDMPGEGIKDLLVVCPAFVSDCLETLEEIQIRERENFMKAGGEKYTYIPCMNTQTQWVSALKYLLTEETTVS